MKKICYVTTISISIKSFFIPQLRYLANNGFDVSVICSPDDNLQSLLGNDVHYIPVEIPRGIDLIGSIKAIKALAKVFKKEKFDLVQYSTPNAALYASIAAKRAKIKIRNYHLMGIRYLGEQGLKRKILRFFERLTCKKSTHIECVSPSNLELATREKLFKAGKGVVVWNGSSGGVDLTRFNYEKAQQWRIEKRREYQITETNFVYGFVGRITKDKGIEELLKAFKSLTKLTNNIRLILIGFIDSTNELSEECIRDIERDNNVIHIPQRADIEKYYPMLDVLVLPSYREGFGNVIIEAGSMGVPAIVSDIPGPIDAILDKQTGIKVPIKDVKKLAKAMQEAWSFCDKEFDKQVLRFVTTHFDSKVLCEKILQRKQKLMEQVTYRDRQ